MRRALLAAALVMAASIVTLAPAGAHGDYSGGWTDPASGAVLDGLRGISGSVSHPHGIQAVHLQRVVPADAGAPVECAAGGGPWTPISGGGAPQVDFTYQVQFPCNIVYRVEATAQAGAGDSSNPFEPDPAPGAFALPATIAVAIPPEPVDDVVASLGGTGKAPRVTIDWREGSEPDLLRYIVSRDGEEIGEVAHGDGASFIDDSPPAGLAIYEVKAVRSGPRGDVVGPASGTDVNVPERATDDDEDDQGDDGNEDADDDGADEGSSDGGGDEPTLGTSSGPSRGSGGPTLGSSSRPSGGGGPPTTLDTGFSETLPFGEGEQEAAAPVTGDGSVVASFDDADEPPFLNQETWTFIAGGLALFMGSMVIRYVTRRAAAAY